jgi:zinc transporter ZupT
MQIPIAHLVIYSLGVSLIAIIGGLFPLFPRWNQKQLHLFVAFGGGTILGAIFLHLLPDALSLGSPSLTCAMMLLGFIGILLVERILVGGGHSPDRGDGGLTRHEVVGITAMVGLSLHSLTGGFALGVGLLDPKLGLVIFVAIIMHKGTEAFSLSTIFRLAEYSRSKSMMLLVLYSLMTPIGGLLSLPLIEALENINLSIPTGLTAGTFLYVATLDLIPEAFHGGKDRIWPFVWLTIGIFVMLGIKLLGA